MKSYLILTIYQGPFQNPSLLTAEAHQSVKRVISVLNDQRSDAQFDLFWNELKNSLDAKKIDEPAQERKRKHRRFFGEDSGTDYLPNTVKGRFKMAYMEAFDHVILQITSRFDQPDYAMYRVMEGILLGAFRGDNMSDDFDRAIKSCTCKQ